MIFQLHKSILLLSVLAIADVFGTFFVWRGAALDSNIDLSFWRFEGLRLCYWMLCFSSVAVLWVLIRRGVKRIMGRTGDGDKSRLQNLVLGLIAAGLATGGEVASSVWYWRRFPWSQPGYAGIPYSPYYPSLTDYLWGHLFGWTVFVAISAVIGFVWSQRKQQGERVKTT